MGWLTSISKWVIALQAARTAASGSGARRVGTFGAALVGSVIGLTAASAAISAVRRREDS